MYCSSCGTALSPQMKYCNRCGAQQTAGTAEQKSLEDQLRSVGVDLFWGTIIGLGLILGGMVVLRKALHLRDAILVFWMILSTAALGVSVALDLFQIQRILRKLKREETTGSNPSLDTNELQPASERALEAANSSSVIESTTRHLEPVPRDEGVKL